MQENPSVIDQIVEFIEKNKVLIIGVIALIGVLSASVGIYSNYIEGQQKEAFEQAYTFDRQLADIIAQKEKGKDFDKKFKFLASKSKEFINDHVGKNASVFLAVKLSDIYSDLGQYTEAVSLLKPMSDNYEKESIYFGLLNVNYANALINLKKFNEAIRPLQSVLAQPSQKYLHPTVLLTLGVIYKELGQADEAKKQFNKVVSEFPKSQSAETAKGLLRYLAIQQG